LEGKNPSSAFSFTCESEISSHQQQLIALIWAHAFPDSINSSVQVQKRCVPEKAKTVVSKKVYSHDFGAGESLPASYERMD
jgi:hypothetical protein